MAKRRISEASTFIVKVPNSSTAQHGGWRDAHICFGGILAAEAEVLFDAFWCSHLDWAPHAQDEGDSRIIPNTSRRCRIQLRCTIKDQLATAAKSICL
ncbi:hypothetical protein BCA33_01435 [Marinobacter sp. AC-23]|nr:hypothetical protein BCA33_01435 [Marinobacter sp. AC-23]